MIDSHCHIDLEAFNLDRDKVLQSAFKAGITRLLVLGLSNSRFNKLRQLKAQYQQLDIALGLHPYFLVEQGHSKTQAMFDQFLRLAEQYQTQYIAFGEMGLDGSLPLSMDYQRQVLEFQLSVATQFRKPIVLHHRKLHQMKSNRKMLEPCHFFLEFGPFPEFFYIPNFYYIFFFEK